MTASSDLRVVSADALAPKLEELARAAMPSLVAPATGDDAELEPLLREADVLLVRHRNVERSWIETARRLKLIHVLGRTPVHVDLAAAEEAGVVVATMPHGGAMAVADHTIALLLAVARKIVPGHLGVVEGAYEKLGKTPSRTSETSFAFNWLGYPDVVEIHGKILGLVGFGEIGQEVARRARGFDMEVLYHRRRPLPAEWEERLGVRSAPLEEILSRSDVLSLHAPHTPETEGLLDVEKLARLKPEAIVVNTSRGGLVDEGALAEALREGRIAGAGLDVFVEEPLPKGHPFTQLPNVVLAPHTGGGSGGGWKVFIRQVGENVERFARGETPSNVVTESRSTS